MIFMSKTIIVPMFSGGSSVYGNMDAMCFRPSLDTYSYPSVPRPPMRG